MIQPTVLAPADVEGRTARLDAIVDANAPCTMVLVMQQGSRTVRLERVGLVGGAEEEHFFGMPIRIESNR